MQSESNERRKLPGHSFMRASFLAAVFLPFLFSASVVDATIVVVPSGLNPGDKYHLAFLTSTQGNATPTSIAVYDARVQAAADAANMGIGSTLGIGDIIWKAIGSTASVNAIDHVAITAPVYRIDDVLVATSSADMFDGNLLAPISRTEQDDGIDYNSSTWTGSLTDGTRHSVFFLGSTSRANLGHSGETDDRRIAANSNIVGNQRRLYGISQEFTFAVTPVEKMTWSRIKALYR